MSEEYPPGERRLRSVRLPMTFMLDIVEELAITPALYCRQGVPKDAVFISSHFDIATQSVWFIYSHPSFSPIAPGCEIPRLEVIMQRVEDVKGCRKVIYIPGVGADEMIFTEERLFPQRGDRWRISYPDENGQPKTFEFEAEM